MATESPRELELRFIRQRLSLVGQQASKIESEGDALDDLSLDGLASINFYLAELLAALGVTEFPR